MNTINMLKKLAKRFPKSIKSRGDYVGLMTGKLKENTNTVLLCLDFDDIVMNSVKKMQQEGEKIDLIITHHPFIYGTKYRVFKKDLVKKDLCERIDALDIPVYSMHTNFDTGKDGMNDALAKALDLHDIKSLDTCPMARGGKLNEPMHIKDFAKYATKRLGLEYSHLIHGGKDVVETVAILGGGGSYKYQNAMLEGYDVYISGDTPHHIRRDVIAYHFNYLDVSHEVERIFMKQMQAILNEIDASIKVIIIDHEKLPELIVA